jgi:hypothetical protein
LNCGKTLRDGNFFSRCTIVPEKGVSIPTLTCCYSLLQTPTFRCVWVGQRALWSEVWQPMFLRAEDAVSALARELKLKAARPGCAERFDGMAD